MEIHFPNRDKAELQSLTISVRFFPIECSQDDFNKDFRAKTQSPQREKFAIFSELGVLCAFARVVVYPIP